MTKENLYNWILQPAPGPYDHSVDEREHTVEQWKGNIHYCYNLLICTIFIFLKYLAYVVHNTIISVFNLTLKGKKRLVFNYKFMYMLFFENNPHEAH